MMQLILPWPLSQRCRGLASSAPLSRCASSRCRRRRSSRLGRVRRHCCAIYYRVIRVTCALRCNGHPAIRLVRGANRGSRGDASGVHACCCPP
jgi:hypothetical protein